MVMAKESRGIGIGAYLAGAGVLGLLWWLALSVSSDLNKLVNPSTPLVLGFVMGSMTLAYLFRGLIAGSESRFGTLFSYSVLPFIGGMLTVLWMYAADYTRLVLSGQSTSAGYDSGLGLFIGVLYGPAAVMKERWFVVLPLALLSQLAMHHLGRRFLGVKAQFRGLFGTQDLGHARSVGR